MEKAALITSEEVEKIHDASLEVLEEVGLLVRNEEARDIFSRHGCTVDRETLIVRFPHKKVEEYGSGFPESFTFRGRDPSYDRTIPRDRPVIVTGSSAPDIMDPVTREIRRSTSRDIANIGFLINELEGFDVFSISTLADDAPPGRFSLSRFYPALKNCTKPVRSNTPNMRDLMDVIELGEIIAGGREAYRERPIITHHYCPVVSPLTMDVESTEALIYLTNEKLPVYGTVVPNAGITAPMTLTGTVVIGNAEFLALGTLMQMISPSSPLIYAVLSTVADMRTAAYAPGAIETGILQMCHSRMADFYGVPSGGYIGLTDAHVNDAQSGYETGMNTTAALLGGTDMLNMGGLLGSLMTFDFAKAVIDGEIACMLKRLSRGVGNPPETGLNEGEFALDLIADIGPGGNYMESAHTIEHMRSAAYFPKVSIREARETWVKAGKQDSDSRALGIAREILNGKNDAVFSPETERAIRSRFTDLVEGNAGLDT